MKNLVFALGLLLLGSAASAQQCSKPPTCPANKVCIEVGTDNPPKLAKGQKFLWLNSTTQPETVTMGSPNPLTKPEYGVRACHRKKAKVLCAPPPGDETNAGEDDYAYSRVDAQGRKTPCNSLLGQPVIKIGR